jgi:hypothetical protein
MGDAIQPVCPEFQDDGKLGLRLCICLSQETLIIDESDAELGRVS